MSSLNPAIASPYSRTLGVLPYQRLAELASGKALAPLPGNAAPTASASSAKAVNLSINMKPAGASGVSLEIARNVAAAAAAKPKKEVPEKGAKAPAPAPSSKAVAAATDPKKASSAAASSVSSAPVPKDEPAALDAAEIAACQVAQAISPTQAKVQAECERLGLSSGKLWRVRSDYYEQELVWRRDVLGARSVQCLCKSMIMENTKVGGMTLEQATKAGRVKYVMIVLQYAGAKLQKEKLTDAVRRMEGSNAVGKKQYSLRMVAQEVSDSLSGFQHNAVTPIGMATPVPVLLSEKIKRLPGGEVWLGGGEVDLKLRFEVAELVSKFTPAGRALEFADVTED